MNIETVRVISKNPDEQGEFIIINKDDFNQDLHVEYVEPELIPEPDTEIKNKK